MIETEDFDAVLYEDDDSDDNYDNDKPTQLDIDKLSQTVVYAADWTVETLKNQIKNGTIFLSPIFQRRDAWDVRTKSKLIESLILGIPVPNIVLADEPKSKRKIVLDGKQRLLSILQFFGEGEPSLPDHGFKLEGLDLLTSLEGQTYQSLKNNKDNVEFLRSYENQTIRTIVLRDWPDESFLHNTFLRLNQGGKKLLGQELRLALHPGEFMRFIDERSVDMKILAKIFRPHPDPRMADSELLLRFLAFHFNRESYRGGMKSFLDQTSRQLSKQWQESHTFQQEVKDLLKQFEEALELGLEIFGKNFSKVYDTEKNTYKARFNKSIFDMLIHPFLRSEIREKVRDKPDVVKKAYEDLFKDSDFEDAVVQATRTADATSLRFQKWESTLEQIFLEG